MTKMESFSKWIKENPQKYLAQIRARDNPTKLVVLFQCEHEKKENHHPDYSKWWEVYRVCRKCHLKIHKENRNDRIVYREPITGDFLEGTVLRGWDVGKNPGRKMFILKACERCKKLRWSRLENGKERNMACAECKNVDRRPRAANSGGGDGLRRSN